MNIKLELNGDWQLVYMEEGIAYSFPGGISGFMKKKYRQPVIYRWNFFREAPDDEKIVYIGEAEELCPQRLNGYLNPGPSQRTNIRINQLLRKQCDKRLNNRLEILILDNFVVDEIYLAKKDLHDKHVRKLLEELLIVLHRNEKYSVLNL